MPELPEVETVRRGLEPVLLNHVLRHVDVRRPDLRWPFPDHMAARLTGRRVVALRRRAKYVLAQLDDDMVWMIHLGMSGRFQIADEALGHFYHPTAMEEKHSHVVIETDAGTQLRYIDPRRFGAMDLCSAPKLEAHAWIKDLGPEPLSNGFSPAYLAARLATRKGPIKNVLLDQHLVVGLGNIYVCEALFDAQVSPIRRACDVAQHEIERLYRAIIDVLERAIVAGGSSLRDHQQVDGQMGYFQHDFQTYGREGAPCRRCGSEAVIVRVVQSGRSSFYCPVCQS